MANASGGSGRTAGCCWLRSLLDDCGLRREAIEQQHENTRGGPQPRRNNRVSKTMPAAITANKPSINADSQLRPSKQAKMISTTS
jgi:hypothetical protein